MPADHCGPEYEPRRTAMGEAKGAPQQSLAASNCSEHEIKYYLREMRATRKGVHLLPYLLGRSCWEFTAFYVLILNYGEVYAPRLPKTLASECPPHSHLHAQRAKGLREDFKEKPPDG